jgi:hypothetical protein
MSQVRSKTERGGAGVSKGTLDGDAAWMLRVEVKRWHGWPVSWPLGTVTLTFLSPAGTTRGDINKMLDEIQAVGEPIDYSIWAQK